MYPKLDVQMDKSELKEGKMSEYIDRESLINHLNQSAAKHYSRAVERVIELEPAADVVPVRRGQWKPAGFTFMGECVDCSECGYRIATCLSRDWNCCPMCTTKMEDDNA